MPLRSRTLNACTSVWMAQMPEGRDGPVRRARLSLRHRWLGLALGFLVIGLSQMASSQTPDSVRAMLEAAARGEVDTLQRLIAAGVSLESANAAGETPLLLAVKDNQLSAAVLLIDAGSNINAQAANKDSPWLLAG